MNDSRKQRKNDSKVAAHFRTHRIHAINSEWYFLTCEGQNIGPFPTRIHKVANARTPKHRVS
jgi:hypothetical protein